MSGNASHSDLAIDKANHLTDKPGSFDPWLLCIWAQLAKLGVADHVIGIDTTETHNFTLYGPDTKGKYDPAVHPRNMAASAETGNGSHTYLANYKAWTAKEFPPRAWDASKKAHIGCNTLRESLVQHASADKTLAQVVKASICSTFVAAHTAIDTLGLGSGVAIILTVKGLIAKTNLTAGAMAVGALQARMAACSYNKHKSFAGMLRDFEATKNALHDLGVATTPQAYVAHITRGLQTAQFAANIAVARAGKDFGDGDGRHKDELEWLLRTAATMSTSAKTHGLFAMEVNDVDTSVTEAQARTAGKSGGLSVPLDLRPKFGGQEFVPVYAPGYGRLKVELAKAKAPTVFVMSNVVRRDDTGESGSPLRQRLPASGAGTAKTGTGTTKVRASTYSRSTTIKLGIISMLALILAFMAYDAVSMDPCHGGECEYDGGAYWGTDSATDGVSPHGKYQAVSTDGTAGDVSPHGTYRTTDSVSDGTEVTAHGVGNGLPVDVAAEGHDRPVDGDVTIECKTCHTPRGRDAYTKRQRCKSRSGPTCKVCTGHAADCTECGKCQPQEAFDPVQWDARGAEAHPSCRDCNDGATEQAVVRANGLQHPVHSQPLQPPTLYAFAVHTAGAGSDIDRGLIDGIQTTDFTNSPGECVIDSGSGANASKDMTKGHNIRRVSPGTISIASAHGDAESVRHMFSQYWLEESQSPAQLGMWADVLHGTSLTHTLVSTMGGLRRGVGTHFCPYDGCYLEHRASGTTIPICVETPLPTVQLRFITRDEAVQFCDDHDIRIDNVTDVLSSGHVLAASLHCSTDHDLAPPTPYGLNRQHVHRTTAHVSHKNVRQCILRGHLTVPPAWVPVVRNPRFCALPSKGACTTCAATKSEPAPTPRAQPTKAPNLHPVAKLKLRPRGPALVAQVDAMQLGTHDGARRADSDATVDRESGYKFAVLFTDMYSGYIFIHLLRSQADLAEALRAYVEHERGLNHIDDIDNVRIQLQSDNAFVSQSFTRLMKDYGMPCLSPCAPHEHNQIGSAEASNGIFRRCFQALMADMSPPRFMDHAAAHHAAWCVNAVGTPQTNYVSRHELHSGKTPDIRDDLPFATICAVHVPSTTRLVGEDKAQFMYYAGHHDTAGSSKFYNNETHRTIVSRSFEPYTLAPCHGLDLENVLERLNANGAATRAQRREKISARTRALGARAADEAVQPTVVQALTASAVQAAPTAATLRARAAAKAAVVASAPATPVAARRSKDAANWALAERKEHDNLFTPRANQSVPALSKVPKSAREHNSITVRCKCVYKHQFSDNGSDVTGYKCRYTYCGSGECPYPQWHGSSAPVTYYDGETAPPDSPNSAPTKGSYDARRTSSPVAYASSHRFILCHAAANNRVLRCYDVRAAYLNAPDPSDQPTYMWPPNGMASYDTNGEPHVWKVNTNIYGKAAASRAWHVVHTEGLLNLFPGNDSWHCAQSTADPCVFYFTKTVAGQQTGSIVLSAHVDDGLFSATDHALADEFAAALSTKWECTHSPATAFLGCDIIDLTDETSGRRIIGLSQAKYIEELGARFDQLDCDAVTNPLMAIRYADFDNGFAEPGSADETAMAGFDYRALTGSLERIAQTTRPDAQRAVHFVAAFQARPSPSAKKWALRVLQYLVTTRHDVIRWWGPKPGIAPPPTQLVVHVDADHASCTKTGRSYTGITYSVDGTGAPYDWVCERQTSVAKDNNVAEGNAVRRAISDTDGFHQPFMAEVGVRVHKALILTDSEATASKIDHFSSRTKTRAENVALHHPREILRKDTIVLGWCDTTKMISDALTKRVTSTTLASHAQHLLGAVTKWYSGQYHA